MLIAVQPPAEAREERSPALGLVRISLLGGIDRGEEARPILGVGPGGRSVVGRRGPAAAGGGSHAGDGSTLAP